MSNAIIYKPFKNFIKTKKEKLYNEARHNTQLNEDGKPTISKDDEWFNEDVWDEHYKKIKDKN